MKNRRFFLSLILFAFLAAPSLKAQLSDGSKGHLKLDVEVQDELGIDTVSQVVQLKYLRASEMEPFIQTRLSRWGAVQVNDALNMVVITDKRIKLNDLTALVRQMDSPKMKDFLRLETVSIPLSYSNPDTVRTLVSGQLSKEGRLIVDNAHNALVITDLKSKIDSIKKIVEQLDVFAPQVEIEVAVVEASGDSLRKAGIDLDALRTAQGTAMGSIGSDRGDNTTTGQQFYYDSSGNLTSSYKNITTTTAGPYPPWSMNGVLNLDQFLNVVNLLETKNRARIMTRTRITTSNNETGVLSAGEKVFYRMLGTRPAEGNTSYNNNNTTDPSRPAVVSASSSQAEQSSVGGLNVRITPLIGMDGAVQLTLYANLDNLTGWSPEGSPIVENRSTQSRVTLKDGETFLLSGLQKTETLDSESGIPILRSILPFIFSKKTHNKIENEVLILLTPHIQRSSQKASAEDLKVLEDVKK